MSNNGGSSQPRADNTTAPCININVCDQLKVNLTSKQALRIFNATKAGYQGVEQFLIREWNALLDRILPPVGAAPEPEPRERKWESYLNQTQVVIEQLVGEASRTWEKLMNVSGDFMELPPAVRKAKKKVAKGMDKLAKGLSNGFEKVRAGIKKGFGSNNKRNTAHHTHTRADAVLQSDRTGLPDTQREPVAEPHMPTSDQQREAKEEREFRSELNDLYQSMRSLEELMMSGSPL